MADVINLIGEKQKRAWEQLEKTCAKIERCRSEREGEVLTSRLQRTQRKLQREGAKLGKPRPRPD